jgi:hypothetical protein
MNSFAGVKANSHLDFSPYCDTWKQVTSLALHRGLFIRPQIKQLS